MCYGRRGVWEQWAAGVQSGVRGGSGRRQGCRQKGLMDLAFVLHFAEITGMVA